MQLQLNLSTSRNTVPAPVVAVANPARPQTADGAGLPPVGTGLPSSQAGAQQPLDARALTEAMQKIQKMLERHTPPLQLTAGWQGSYVVAKLVDPQTKKVLFQIPPEQVVQLAEQPDRLSGLVLQAQA